MSETRDQRNVRAAMDACRTAGIDPLPIMAIALREMGYVVLPPETVDKLRIEIIGVLEGVEAIDRTVSDAI